jgi:hypothetical protein
VLGLRNIPSPCASRRRKSRYLVLQWFDDGVTMVLQWFDGGVTMVLHWWYDGVTMVLQ